MYQKPSILRKGICMIPESLPNFRSCFFAGTSHGTLGTGYLVEFLDLNQCLFWAIYIKCSKRYEYVLPVCSHFSAYPDIWPMMTLYKSFVATLFNIVINGKVAYITGTNLHIFFWIGTTRNGSGICEDLWESLWVNHSFKPIRDFHKLDEIGNNANIGIRGFTTWKKSSDKMLPPVGIEPRSLIESLWFQVQHSPFYTNLAFAFKTETLEFFTNQMKLAIMPILASEALLREKNPMTKCYPQWE